MDGAGLCGDGFNVATSPLIKSGKGCVENLIKLVECPRDAWQGLPELIPTEYKTEYLKELVLAGFKHIDAVSFVSRKHVKQMADSEAVMAQLNASLPLVWSSQKLSAL